MGVALVKGVNTPDRRGSALAAAASSCAAASRAAGPRVFLSCSIILEPPAWPLPLTGGVRVVGTHPPSIVERRVSTDARTPSAVSPGGAPSSDGLDRG